MSSEDWNVTENLPQFVHNTRAMKYSILHIVLRTAHKEWQRYDEPQLDFFEYCFHWFAPDESNYSPLAFKGRSVTIVVSVLSERAVTQGSLAIAFVISASPDHAGCLFGPVTRGRALQ